MQLPTRLKNEPLVDAICELRMEEVVPFADILPGILFHKLDPQPKIKRLPVAEIPQPVRANDPSLRYEPTQRLEWGHYVISVGDHNVVISCKLPYPGWPKFKAKILEIVNLIADVGVAGKVERFSIKYVNLIEAPSLAEQSAKINLTLHIGALKQVDNSHINMQVRYVDGDACHILTVITGANARMPDGREAFGVVVDIDSIQNVEPIRLDEFEQGLADRLEALRQSNKAHFFSCLKQKTIDEMGPTYE